MSGNLLIYRQTLANHIEKFLIHEQKNLGPRFWSKDVFSRLVHFSQNGKLLRGSLFLASYHLFSEKNWEAMLPLAAALELMQSALLIHDDIIDNDAVRRGQPSLMAQYQQLTQNHGHLQSQALGQNLAICVGDICFFLGFRALGNLELDARTQLQILNRFSEEYMQVGLGEMHDVTQTADRGEVTKKEVLEVYIYKTARYTLVLPLMMAGMVAKISPTEATKVEKIAEAIGLIFQIKDDELGLFGTEAEIGKSVMSDMREGKKTLFYISALDRANAEQDRQLRSAFGNSDLTQDQFLQARALVEKLGARDNVNKYLLEIKTQLQVQIDDLDSHKWQSFFRELISFNISRKK